jgi:tetratricopeptide (TPR) repeat protein
VGDDSLSQCISELRKVLKDSARAPEYIRTVPKRGYCFLPEVAWENPPADDAPRDVASRGGGRTHPRAGLLVVVALCLMALVLAATLVGVRQDESEPPLTSGDLMSLLSPGAEAASRVRWTSTAPAAEAYVIERTWLEGDRARLALRDDTGTALWSVVRPLGSEQERRSAAAELVKATALIDEQETGPILLQLPPEQRRLFKRARYHLDRRSEADLSIARELLEQVLAHDPEFVEAILAMAELQRQLARYDLGENASIRYRDAYEVLVLRAKQVAPEHPAVRALAYEPGAGVVDWQQYESDLRALVAEAPDCAACVNRLSEFYLEVGWFEEALKVWEQHRRYWPLSVRIHATIARLHARLGQAAEALRKVELIRALSDDEAWDVRAAEVNAYLLLGDTERWLQRIKTLLAPLGEAGKDRLAIMEAMAAGDDEALASFATSPAVRDFNIALTLGVIEPLVERVQRNVANGDYRDLGLVHGWNHDRNRLTRYYLDGLRRLQNDPRIEAVFADTGLLDFWRTQEKFPDYCTPAGAPLYCQ